MDGGDDGTLFPRGSDDLPQPVNIKGPLHYPGV